MVVNKGKQSATTKGQKDKPLAGSDSNPSYTGNSSTQRKKEAKSDNQATALLKVAENEDIGLFHDQYQEPYSRIRFPEGSKIIAVDSEDFDDWLRNLAYADKNWVPANETIRSVRRQFIYRAKQNGIQHALHIRVAQRDSAVWIDLDGCRAIKVVAGKWSIVKDPPILFRTPKHQKPLIAPVTGGDPWKVMEFLNIPDKDDQLLFMIWLVAAFIPDIPIPAMVLHGPPGSAKTSTLKLVKKLVDPSEPEIAGKPRDLKDFMAVASNNRMLVFDNLSGISADLSDLLCGAITGDGIQKRELYSDNSTFARAYRCIVGLAGIELPASRSDLLDRSIILNLPAVEEERRALESDLKQRFMEESPEILGGLLDTLASALMLKKHIHLDKYPRMADFVDIGCAISEALGARQEEFVSAYMNNIGAQRDAALESNPLATAICDLMSETDEWTGTATELLGTLNGIGNASSVYRRSKEWPKTASSLSGKLNYLEESLKHFGIMIEHPPRTSSKRLIVLRRAVPLKTLDEEMPETGISADDDGSPDSNDGAAQDSVIPEPASKAGCDADDADDAVFSKVPGGVDLENTATYPPEWLEHYKICIAEAVMDGVTPPEEAHDAAVLSVFRRFVVGPK